MSTELSMLINKEKKQNYITETDKLIQQGFLKSIYFALTRYGFLGSLARYLKLQEELTKFVRNGHSVEEKKFRKKLIKQFSLIQKKVPCAHPVFQFIPIAEYIFNLKEEGPIVECGCSKGGSTAKLSLLAKKTNRYLYVCDSFAGLPKPESEEELFLNGYADFPNHAFAVGEYKGSFQEVRENIRLYGSIENCIFVPGLFNESLAELDIKPAFVFIDVDLISSARDCLKYLWPKLINGGYWFTHEAMFPQYIAGILDSAWWHEALGESPPVIYGAGNGFSPISKCVAYFQKK